MKLEDARQHYYTFSSILSDVNRQLCFAGIAVIWIFSVGEENGLHSLPKGSFFPLGCFVLGLALDLLHYVIATASWGWYHRRIEKQGIGEDKDFTVPACINWLPLLFFWGKCACTCVGYVALLFLIFL